MAMLTLLFVISMLSIFVEEDNMYDTGTNSCVALCTSVPSIQNDEEMWKTSFLKM